MNDEKKTDGEIVIQKGKFLTWLDNYWYHYKWATIIVAFFLIVFLVCTIQFCTKADYDIIITYAGPESLKADEEIAFQKTLEDNLPENFANKEDPTAELLNYYILSTEQIEKLEKQTETDSNGEEYAVYVDKGFITSEMDSFESQLNTGSSSVLFIDRWLYDSFLDAEGNCERLMPLSDVLDDVPASAVGAYGIRLGDTDLYKNNPQLSFLPEDTIICLHKKVVFGKSDYDREIEAFKAYVKISDSEKGKQ